MIRLSLVLLALGTLPAAAQITPRLCTDLALSLETNHAGARLLERQQRAAPCAVIAFFL